MTGLGSAPAKERQDARELLGVWKLTLAAVEPGNAATIEVYRDSLLMVEVPRVLTDASAFTFVYPDGRRTIYFYANLLCADYTPAKRPRPEDAS